MIELRNVSKSFGNEKVLDGVSAKFSPGFIHGIIGRNGSGKTVLLKIICGLLKPDSGEIVVNGKLIGIEIETPKSIGAIIESPGFLPYHSGYKNLSYLARLSGKATREQIEEAMSTVGLSSSSKKMVWKYSLGMKQRLGMAQAIMENPDVLILDEPFNGLDKHGVFEMREVLKKLQSEGKTILLATHIQQDIEDVCNTVCEIEGGSIVSVR